MKQPNVALCMSIFALCFCGAQRVIAQPTTEPANVASPPSIQAALDNLHLDNNQKDSAAHLLHIYREKQQEAETQLLRGLQNMLSPQQYGQLVASLDHPTTEPSISNEKDAQQIPVTFTGGYDTDPRDRGRPVVLIAAALGVPSDVFRKAFSGVHPAGPGQTPEESQVRRNKQVLMEALGPYGITDDRLNEVSNYYRYNRSAGEMWRHSAASAVALVKDGKVLGVKILDGGAGYSSSPTVEIPQMPQIKLQAKLSYGTDFAKNGSVSAIDVVDSSSPAK